MDEPKCKKNGVTTFFAKEGNQRFMNILALLLIIFSMGYFGALLFVKVPEENIRFVDTIIGFLLGSVVSVVINYYFGASTTLEQTWDGSDRRTIDPEPNPSVDTDDTLK